METYAFEEEEYYIDFDANYMDAMLCLLWLIFAGKSSYVSDLPSLAVAASKKILVPDSQSDGSSSLTQQLGATSTVAEDPQVYDTLCGAKNNHKATCGSLDKREQKYP
ncbi:hypothetical protein ACFX13_014071 [Malus domestica]